MARLVAILKMANM